MNSEKSAEIYTWPYKIVKVRSVCILHFYQQNILVMKSDLFLLVINSQLYWSAAYI